MLEINVSAGRRLSGNPCAITSIDRSYSPNFRIRRSDALALIAVVDARFNDHENVVIGSCQSDGADRLQVVDVKEVAIESSSTLGQVHEKLARPEEAFSPPSIASSINCLLSFNEPAEAIFAEHPDCDVVYEIDLDENRFGLHFRRPHPSPDSLQPRLDSIVYLLETLTGVEGSILPVGTIQFADPKTQQRVLEFGCGEQHMDPSFYSLEPSKAFTFHRLFEQQVTQTPDNIAVRAKEDPESTTTEDWTYRRLNGEANAVAKRLIEAGVTVEDTVGLMMERRCCLLAAMIGVMKAGARYVGLETDLPIDRLSFMVSDAANKAILTDHVNAKRATEVVASLGGQRVDVIDVDAQRFVNFKNGLHQNEDNNPDTAVHSRNGAYIIYTSGSTGKPKGVDVWHHSFVDLCFSFSKRLSLTDQDTCLAIATIAFDASIAELFPLLLLGGTVAVGGKQIGANGQALSEMIDLVSATYLCATPTSLRILVASGWQRCPRLTVVAGGEAVSALACSEIGPKIGRLLNGYGPTEGTVYATIGDLSESQTEPVPIGPPIFNSRLYVLDDAGQLVPPMVKGNLFIGGQSPTRGYLNRPELTAEKFVADPFADPNAFPDAKMYNSGDTAYWLPEGVIQYVGRSDHQAKLRGYRIELGEIETRLNRHPAVKDCVVMVREDTPGQQRLVAYVIYQHPVSDSDLQDYLAQDMPEYMVPTWFVALDTFPTNANFKLDRKALPNPDDVASQKPISDVQSDWQSSPKRQSDQQQSADRQALAENIAEIWSAILNRSISIDAQVFRMGADSLTAVKFQVRLQEVTGHQISIGEVFQYPTAAALAGRLLPQRQVGRKSVFSNASPTAIRDIAVVGMAGRFPGASNVDEFWDNLAAGVESIRDFTHNELIQQGVSPAEFLHPNYVPRGTVLEDAYGFEPEFFGVTRNDAEVLSPQIRLFMKTAWEALEQAGYPSEPESVRIGVFAGGGHPNYLTPGRHLAELQRLQCLVGNGADFMATRTAYALGLTGPAIGIQTACSSSLVAVANAVDAIRTGKCEMAIAGGSSFSWPHQQGYQHGEGLIYSSDGHCRAFDHRATGTLFSQAAGVVLLCPLEDAIARGDTVHAVIKGVAVNNDGNRKGGFASPSIKGQSEVIRMALDDAGVTADQITLMEAHGTGTKIGDPIEVLGLTQAWRQDTDRTGFCALGSVKANVGHADAAAGIVGLLKVVMSLKHRKIAPLVNYEAPNPEINFQQSPFYITGEVTDWQSENDHRFAAVSAFGMGGTNAHLVLSQGQPNFSQTVQCPPKPLSSDVETGGGEMDGSPGQGQEQDQAQGQEQAVERYLIPFSARTGESLKKMIQRWADLDSEYCYPLEDLAYTLQVGRKAFRHRSFTVVDSSEQLRWVVDVEKNRESDSSLETELADRSSLTAGDRPRFIHTSLPSTDRKAVFCFPGQGAQYAGMAKELFRDQPVFRSAISRCDEALKTKHSSVIDWLFAGIETVDINQTQYAQVALFSVSYALAKLWQSWGVEPVAMIGHSIGEYVAAAIADVMSVEDAVRIVQRRSQLMQAQQTGSMLAVMHGESPIEQLLTDLEAGPEVDLAVVNSPTVAVVAGRNEAVIEFATQLEARGITSKFLKTSHAFHSRMMEPMLGEFINAFDGVALKEPSIAYLSNVSGSWITGDQCVDPNYYASQIRSTVRFADNLKTLFDSRDDLLLIEMGPGETLTQLAKTQIGNRPHVAISTLPVAKQADHDSHRAVIESAGRAWAAGLNLDWNLFNAGKPKKGRRVPLPTYRFDEQNYRAPAEQVSPSVLPLEDECWYNVPGWRQANPWTRIEFADHAPGCNMWLVFSPGNPTGDRREVLLKNQIADVRTVIVTPGEEFAKIQDDHFQIRAGQADDYVRLLETIGADKNLAGVVHQWSANLATAMTYLPQLREPFWTPHQQRVFSLAWLSKAIGETIVDRTIPLNVLTTGISTIDPEVPTVAENHCLVGAASVAQKEYRSIATKVIDLGRGTDSIIQSPSFGDLLRSIHHEPLLALDRGQYWAKDFDQVNLSPKIQLPLGVRAALKDGPGVGNGSAIVFTGGLGALARNMALELAGRYLNLSIALLVRKPLPDPLTWDQHLNDSAGNSDADCELRQRITDVRKLQSLCRLEILRCDVADRSQVTKSMKSIKSKFGKIDAVFHAAGILDDGVIATRTDGNLRPVFAAKSLSAKNICDEILQHHPSTGSVVFFSSIASDLGLFGQFAYSAANNYLDGLTQQLTRDPAIGTKFFSINWPAFREVGMAVRSQANLESDAALSREMAENSFTIAEGTEAMVNVMATDRHRRVVISKKPFAQRFSLAVADGNSVRFSEQLEAGDASANTDGGSVDETMLSIWCDQFGNDNLDLDVDYFDLGGDSLMAVGMIASIEKAFGKMMPISHLINSPTPRTLIKRLGIVDSVDGQRSNMAGAVGAGAVGGHPGQSPGQSFPDRALPDNVICLKKSPTDQSSQPPLFLIHGADGAVMFYRDFAKRLKTDRTIYAIESPSLGNAHWQIPETVQQLAQQYVATIKSVQPAGPYLIGGYSFGGVAAFEISQQLESIDDSIESLILFDIPNPAVIEHAKAFERLKHFWERQDDQAAKAKMISLTKRTFRAVRDRATVEIENRVSRMKSEDTESAFWRHKRARERHMAMEKQYLPGALSGPLRLIAATGNGSKFRSDASLGWAVVSNDWKVLEVPGSHLELFNDDYVKGLVDSTEIFLQELDS